MARPHGRLSIPIFCIIRGEIDDFWLFGRRVQRSILCRRVGGINHVDGFRLACFALAVKDETKTLP